jgi:hypothetical protein
MSWDREVEADRMVRWMLIRWRWKLMTPREKVKENKSGYQHRLMGW